MDKLRAAAKAVAAVNDMRDPVYGGKKEESVRVCVRCRPLNSKERGDGRERIVHVDPKNGTCVVSPIGSNEPPKTFTFDQVYDESVTQEYIYMNTASRIVESVIDGFNGTIFAYGQTGTGKTYTMLGACAIQQRSGRNKPCVALPRSRHRLAQAARRRRAWRAGRLGTP